MTSQIANWHFEKLPLMDKFFRFHVWNIMEITELVLFLIWSFFMFFGPMHPMLFFNILNSELEISQLLCLLFHSLNSNDPSTPFIVYRLLKNIYIFSIFRFLFRREANISYLETSSLNLIFLHLNINIILKTVPSIINFWHYVITTVPPY